MMYVFFQGGVGICPNDVLIEAAFVGFLVIESSYDFIVNDTDGPIFHNVPDSSITAASISSLCNPVTGKARRKLTVK